MITKWCLCFFMITKVCVFVSSWELKDSFPLIIRNKNFYYYKRICFFILRWQRISFVISWLESVRFALCVQMDFVVLSDYKSLFSFMIAFFSYEDKKCSPFMLTKWLFFMITKLHFHLLPENKRERVGVVIRGSWQREEKSNKTNTIDRFLSSLQNAKLE